MVTVRAPATVANLGSGFDVFGIALRQPADIIHVEKAEETTIQVNGIGSNYIPTSPKKNTAGVVAEELDAPATITINKGIRPSSGLGSSAASAAGTALALNALYGQELSREELVWIAAKGESAASGEPHADNVAPSLLGGFTIATPDGITTIDAHLDIVVCLPEITVSTRNAREMLPKSVDLHSHVQTVGNAATLTAGMTQNNPELVGRGLSDSVVTPTRTNLISGYESVHQAAMDAGATGVTIGGSGPTMLAIPKKGKSREVASAMVSAFLEQGVNSRAYQTNIGPGAELYL
tara:strand:+ start:17950 stop:18828 length:879 start_codon:yes stop_codon:yes gene_type:complete